MRAAAGRLLNANTYLNVVYRETKEKWIRSKYEQRAYMAPLPPTAKQTSPSNSALSPSLSDSITQQIVNATLSRDLRQLTLVLAYSNDDHVNVTLSQRDRRTPLHLACSIGAPDVTQMLLWVCGLD
jgi:Arf-GAP/GTPase/ANK repeat/PH domain-containing protein 1/3